MMRFVQNETIKNIFTDLFSGLLVGFYLVIIAITISLFLFSGINSIYLSLGISLALLSTFIINIVIVSLKKYWFSVGTTDIPTGAILAIIIERIFKSTSYTQLLPTLIVALFITTISIGFFLFMLGKLRWGNYSRYLPYPVIAGFLAGVGWIVLISGVDIVINGKFTLAILSDFNKIVQLFLSFCVASSLFVLLKKYPYAWTMPMFIILVTIACHLILVMLKIPKDVVIREGWLLSSIKQVHIWQQVHLSMWNQIAWRNIFGQIPYFFAAILVNAVNFLLHISSLEVAIKKKIKLNRELKVYGVGNLLGGLIAGVPVGLGFVGTLLALRSGVKTKLFGFVVAFTSLIVLFLTPDAVSLFPRLVIGGLLIYISFTLIHKWIIDVWYHLSIVDSLTVMTILITIMFFGILPGILVGIIITGSVFIINYTHLNPIKYELSGEVFHSKVVRPMAQQRELIEQGKLIRIIKLQGYLFFGTAKSLVDRVTKLIEQSGSEKIKFILLDFQLAGAVDSSAIFRLSHLYQCAREANVDFILTNLSAPTIIQFKKIGLISPKRSKIYLFSDIDHGLEWCENQLLAKMPTKIKKYTLERTLSDYLPMASHQKIFLTYLQRIEITANQFLFHQNEPSDCLYFIESGEVTIYYEDDHSMIRLLLSGPGTIVGEIGFYLHIDRTATVRTESKCVLYRLTESAMKRMEEQQADISLLFYQGIIRVLAERIKHMNYEIAILKR